MQLPFNNGILGPCCHFASFNFDDGPLSLYSRKGRLPCEVFTLEYSLLPEQLRFNDDISTAKRSGGTPMTRINEWKPEYFDDEDKRMESISKKSVVLLLV